MDFAGIKVDNITLDEAASKILEFIKAGTPRLIVTPNPELIVAAQEDQELRKIINNASLRVPDGISMVVVSKILGQPLKERVSGIDLMLKVCEQENPRVFLLGGKEGIAEAAAQKLKAKVVGTQNGYFEDEAKVIEKIKVTKPDVLFVGLGGGRQERWANHHLQELGVPVVMTIGGSLDVISGQKKRAPKIFQKLYIEWLYRLITEPNRWKRQLALPKFLWLMFCK
ncbi:MAG: WecB/TagA/CpsF family glycosyltransferase [Candidatus Margulisbacteria bacterium]|nr:WecB/TagA/CpsF family glycosyltransferase [Candidatus Margulisiibacteriota bacterium]